MICEPRMFIWKSNPEWYDYDENDEPYLTDKAPEEAKESFEIWKEIEKSEQNTRRECIKN